MNSEFINRDLSWLSFNERVLQEAQDKSVPLIERMRFLGIYSNNQDEFFRVRVATNIRLKEALASKNPDVSKIYASTLNQIHEKVLNLQTQFRETYRQIAAELEEMDVYIRNENELTDEQAKVVREYFVEEVESLITPIILTNLKRFPYLKDKSVYLYIILEKNSGKTITAVIELPTDYTNRFLVLPNEKGEKKHIIYLDDIIRHSLPHVLSIFQPKSIKSYAIKLTRDAELDLDDDFSQSYYSKIEKSLSKRKKGKPVRFVYDKEMPKEHLEYILKSIAFKYDENIIPGARYHNFRDFMAFPDLSGKGLVFKPLKDIPHKDLVTDQPILKQCLRKDILFQFPYHSFDYIIDIIRESSIDPKVAAIKISLYRLAPKSKIIKALKNAARNGKRVEVIIELRARFDEEANLEWSKQLKDENISVSFGIQGLKVHSKLLLIQRKTKGELLNFAVISTGNFHEKTSRIYCDTALVTANPLIANEVETVFKLFNKPYLNYHFEQLLVAPNNLRKNIYSLIDNEILLAKNGQEGSIFIKLNNMVDEGVAKHLLMAAQKGVKIKLLARGVCSLVSGENLEIRSIVGRYLEHSRVFCFGNAGKPRIYIGSADLMTRNLDVRVEVLTPILDPLIKQELLNYLDLQWQDNQKARLIDSGLTNKVISGGDKNVNAQISLYADLKA